MPPLTGFAVDVCDALGANAVAGEGYFLADGAGDLPGLAGKRLLPVTPTTRTGAASGGPGTYGCSTASGYFSRYGAPRPIHTHHQSAEPA